MVSGILPVGTMHNQCFFELCHCSSSCEIYGMQQTDQLKNILTALMCKIQLGCPNTLEVRDGIDSTLFFVSSTCPGIDSFGG
jgi:hypothetical protein